MLWKMCIDISLSWSSWNWAFIEDAHITFEALDARGTPSLQSDLIKNMARLEAVKVDYESINATESSVQGYLQ